MHFVIATVGVAKISSLSNCDLNGVKTVLIFQILSYHASANKDEVSLIEVKSYCL